MLTPNPGAPYRAGLDVFEDEPETKAGLMDCHNVVAVPHIASASLWTRSGMVRNPTPHIWSVFGTQMFADHNMDRVGLDWCIF